MPPPRHTHPHHHRPGEDHPAAVISPSLLRLGLKERLAIAALLIALIWAAALWSLA